MSSELKIQYNYLLIANTDLRQQTMHTFEQHTLTGQHTVFNNREKVY